MVHYTALPVPAEIRSAPSARPADAAPFSASGLQRPPAKQRCVLGASRYYIASPEPLEMEAPRGRRLSSTSMAISTGQPRVVAPGHAIHWATAMPAAEWFSACRPAG